MGEAVDGQGRDVDERLGAVHQVANDLADRGPLQEAMPTEARRVQEPLDPGDSPTSALWSGVIS